MATHTPPLSELLNRAARRSIIHLIAMISFAMLTTHAPLLAQPDVVLDNTQTDCAYGVAIKWGDISNCTTSPERKTCDEPTTSSTHAVPAYTLVTIPVPMGYGGPCTLQVWNSTFTTLLATCGCHKVSCNPQGVTDCHGSPLPLDMDGAWTVRFGL